MMAGFLRYRNSIMTSIQEQRDVTSDLEIVCSDGSVKVQGLVLASLLPGLKLSVGLDECCVLLPDVTKDHLETFLQYLFKVSLNRLRKALRNNFHISYVISKTDLMGVV